MEKKVRRRVRRRVQEKARLVDETTPFAITEAFDQLRTNIMYTPHDAEGCPVYGVTSAEMSVGKSTITANLALSFAQLGKKVLLVDADMRRPTQHKIFELGKENNGLSELLSEIANDDAALIKRPHENLNIITSGAIPPNPSALMLGKKIGKLINKWKNEYDIVFIDLPPVGMVTDPITISEHISGYVMVATINKSDARHVNDAIDAVEQVGAKIIGLVINGINPKGEGYRYSKNGYKYEYRYGYYANTEDTDTDKK